MTQVITIRRRSARILVTNESKDVLLLKFEYGDQNNHRSYWATVGGGLEAGETPEQAARRELLEKVGLAADIMDYIGAQAAQFTDPNGNRIEAEEHFFHTNTASRQISLAGLSGDEAAMIKGHKWWSVEELKATNETYFPSNLPELLQKTLSP